jgi:hypothetical protein
MLMALHALLCTNTKWPDFYVSIMLRMYSDVIRKSMIVSYSNREDGAPCPERCQSVGASIH